MGITDEHISMMMNGGKGSFLFFIKFIPSLLILSNYLLGMGGGMGGGGNKQEEEVVEEKTAFTVKLKSFDAKSKIKVIAFILFFHLFCSFNDSSYPW